MYVWGGGERYVWLDGERWAFLVLVTEEMIGWSRENLREGAFQIVQAWGY